MKKFGLSVALLTALGVASYAAPAIAQDGDNFRRDRNVGVRDRPRPEYDAAGIRWGGFRLVPELITAVEFNDNVFATDTVTDEDIIFHLDPKADLRSQWSNHELNFSLAAPSRFYNDFDENNTTDVI